MENNQLIDISALSPDAIALVHRFGADILEAGRIVVSEYKMRFGEPTPITVKWTCEHSQMMLRERFFSDTVKVFAGPYAERATRFTKRELYAAFGPQE